jgi:hypothetical protein
VTCPAWITRHLTGRNAVIFGAACRHCPPRAPVHHRQRRPHRAPAQARQPVARRPRGLDRRPGAQPGLHDTPGPWSSRLLAAELGISNVKVADVWREYGLQPWRSGTFKFSTDPELEAKLRDVVGLYLNPPDKAVVLCVDEKSGIQAYPGDNPGVRDGR